MRREDTWPVIELYGPSYAATWKALYDRFGLDFESSLDLSQPDDYWQRYLYFNAGWFFHESPQAFGSALPGLCARDPRQPARGAGLPGALPLAGPDRPAAGHPFLRRRPSGSGPRGAGRRCDLPLPHPAAALRPGKRPRRRGAGDGAPKTRTTRRILRDWEPVKRMVYQNKGRRRARCSTGPTCPGANR